MIPTVQLSRDAIDTIWSAVWMSDGRRIFGIASIAPTVSNIFIPMGCGADTKEPVEAGDLCGPVHPVARCAGWKRTGRSWSGSSPDGADQAVE